MIAWRGAGVVVFLLAMVAFLAIAVLLDGPTKGELWPWGAGAALVGLITLPMGIALNRKRSSGQTHDFMFIPMQYWGGLLLVGGIGALVAHLVMGGMGGMGGQAEVSPCDEVGSTLAACPEIGPAAGMLVGMCAQSPEAAQIACRDCLQSAADPCNARACDACSFRPAPP